MVFDMTLLKTLSRMISDKLLSMSCGVYIFAISAAQAAEEFIPSDVIDTHLITEGENHAGEIVDHGTHGAAHGAEHASAGLPQFDVTSFPSQIFWLFVAFIILYIIFSFKTLPEISSVIEKRNESINNDLELAEKIKAEAEAVQHSYEEGLAIAREKSNMLSFEAEAAAKQLIEARLNDFKKASDKDVKNLNIRIEKSKATVLNEINDITADVVRLSVLKVAGIEISKDDALRIILSLNEQQKKAA